MKKRIVCGIAGAYLFLAILMGSLYYRSQAIPWHEKYAVICHALGRTAEGETIDQLQRGIFI